MSGVTGVILFLNALERFRAFDRDALSFDDYLGFDPWDKESLSVQNRMEMVDIYLNAKTTTAFILCLVEGMISNQISEMVIRLNADLVYCQDKQRKYSHLVQSFPNCIGSEGFETSGRHGGGDGQQQLQRSQELSDDVSTRSKTKKAQDAANRDDNDGEKRGDEKYSGQASQTSSGSWRDGNKKTIGGSSDSDSDDDNQRGKKGEPEDRTTESPPRKRKKPRKRTIETEGKDQKKNSGKYTSKSAFLPPPPPAPAPAVKSTSKEPSPPPPPPPLSKSKPGKTPAPAVQSTSKVSQPPLPSKSPSPSPQQSPLKIYHNKDEEEDGMTLLTEKDGIAFATRATKRREFARWDTVAGRLFF